MMAPISASATMVRRWPKMERAFADHQNQLAALLQADVGRPNQEIRADARGDRGHAYESSRGRSPCRR